MAGTVQPEGAGDGAEGQYHRRYEDIAAGVVVHDRDGRVTHANRAACDILQLSLDALLGRTPLDPHWRAIREDGRPFPGEEHPAMVTLRTGKPQRNVVMGVYAGEPEAWRWISISSEPIRNPESGDLFEVLATFVDITERKRDQEALRLSEQRLRNLVETTSDWVWEVDENLKYTYVSPRVRDILGLEPAEVLGRTPCELMPPDERDRLSGLVGETVAARRPFISLQNVAVHRDGHLVVLETSGLPFYDDDGRFRGYRGIDRDITDRKHAELAIRRERDFSSAIVDTVGSLVVVLDIEGRIVRFNRTCEQCTGYTFAEVEGRPFWDLFLVPEEVAAVRRIFETICAGELRLTDAAFPHHYENFWLTKSRDRRLIAWANSVLTGPGDKIEYVIGTGIDITDQRLLEEQFRHSQKLEAVGTLAGGIAHDFNNLLTVIIGYSQLASEQIPQGDPLALEIEEIRKAGERAASLTRQLLAFSRRQVLLPKVIDLNDVVADMDNMLRRLIGEDIDLRTVLEPSLGRVTADPGQIEQIIVNLAVNARDAMPQGGHLTIETRNAELDEGYAQRHAGVQPGSYAMLAVSDTGHGIGDAVRGHLFEPFFTTKATGRGTGLGLSTVYGIVQQSGGHIWVYSEPGRGATFKIYLPVVEAAPSASRELQRRPRTVGGTETILLVEDEPALRGMAREVLLRHGYTVLEATDGASALRLVRERRPEINLLLTDVVMPRISGRELAESLTVLCKGIKVLFVSGYSDSAVVHNGLVRSSAAFLQKPFAPEALLRAVRDLLDTRTR